MPRALAALAVQVRSVDKPRAQDDAGEIVVILDAPHSQDASAELPSPVPSPLDGLVAGGIPSR
ncbi:MAG: hypothetical protein HY720_18225 [Planctomycetes bacterium]|nr:hypothetical protein [Planctomycetota bacterium]